MNDRGLQYLATSNKGGNNHCNLSNLWKDIMLKEIPEEEHRLARRTQETLIEKTRARAQDRVPANILR